MKTQIETSDGIVGGRQITFNEDLADGGIRELSVDALGFSKFSVEVFCSTDSGVGGTINMKQRNRTGGLSYGLATATALALTAGESITGFDKTVTGRYLVFDINNATFGTSGYITLIATLKI